MDQQSWFILISVFVGVCAIALCIQAGMLIALYKTARATEEQVKKFLPKVEAVIPKVEAVIPKVEALIHSSTETIDMSRKQIHDITTKATEILDLTKAQIVRIDGVLEDASARAHNQLAHAEMVIDDTVSRAQQTVHVVQTGIMKPLREVQGVAAGVRTAIYYLVRGGRPTPNQATADEEMFI